MNKLLTLAALTISLLSSISSAQILPVRSTNIKASTALNIGSVLPENGGPLNQVISPTGNSCRWFKVGVPALNSHWYITNTTSTTIVPGETWVLHCWDGVYDHAISTSAIQDAKVRDLRPLLVPEPTHP